jgi:hypothetical protein
VEGGSASEIEKAKAMKNMKSTAFAPAGLAGHMNSFSIIVFGNGVFLASSSSALFTSSDGVTWTRGAAVGGKKAVKREAYAID